MKFLTLSLLAALFLGQLHAQHHNDHIPAESLLVFRMSDMPGQQERIALSPMGQAWKAVDWMALFNAFATMAAEEDEGSSTEELTRSLRLFQERYEQISAHLSGDVSFVIGDLGPFVQVMKENSERRSALWENIDWDSEDDLDLDRVMAQDEELDAKEMQAIAQTVYLMVDVRDGTTLIDQIETWIQEGLQRDPDSRATLSSRDWRDFKIHTLTIPDEDENGEAEDTEASPADPDSDVAMHWTLVQDTLLLAFSDKGLQDAVERVLDRPANRLSTSPEFQAAMAHLEEPDTFLFANLPELDRLIRLGLPAEAPGQEGMSPEAILRQIGLDSLASFSLGVRTSETGMESRSRFGFQRESMLSRLLMTPVDQLKPAETPNFVHRDVSQAVSVHFSLSRFYDALEKEIAALAPEAAMALGFARMAASQQLGFDYKTGFLDHLDSGIIIAQENDWELMAKLMEMSEDPDDFMAAMEARMENPTGGTYYLVAIQLRNQDAVKSAINTLLAQVFDGALPEPELYRDHPLHFPMAAMPQTPETMRRMMGYTFLDDYLLLSIGHPRMLQRAVDSSQDAAQRLWTREEYQQLRAKLPPVAHAIDYTSSEAMSGAYRFLIRMFENQAKESGASFPDLSPITGLFGDSVGVTRRNGLILESRNITPFRESR